MSNGKNTRLAVEEVEPRVLLAGNVVVDVNPGDDMGILGDNLGNNIVVTAFGGNTLVLGIGTTLSTNTPGTVQIGPLGFLATIQGTVVGDDLKVLMGDGADSLLLSNLTVTDDLLVDMGPGLIDIGTLVNMTVLNEDGKDDDSDATNFGGGAGIDIMTVSGGNFTGGVQIGGGANFDILSGQNAPVFNDGVAIFDFEFTLGF